MSRALQVISIVLAIMLWQLATTLTHSEIMPSPARSFLALWQLGDGGELARDLAASISRVLVGFIFAILGGIGFGMLVGLVPLLGKMLLPLCEVLRPIPPIAWIPLSVILFGLDDPSAYFVIFLGAFFPILTNTLLGIQEIPVVYLEVAHSLGIPRWSRYKDVIWPASLPSIFAGLRVGLGFAWMCVIAAEMIAASSGLGYAIQLYRQTLRLDRVVAEMIVIGVTGALMTHGMLRLSWLCLPWRRPAARVTIVSGSLEDECTGLTPKVAQQSASVNSFLSKPAGGLEVSNVSFAYPSSADNIIKKLSFRVRPGEVVSILGPSGSGKSTLLRLIAGLEEPNEGYITVEGGSPAERSRAMTMVFQSGAIFPWKTAIDNIALGALLHLRKRKDRLQMATSLLDLVGLSNKAGFYPHQLSGGQQQRVAVARALANQPSVLLLDEPFGALDSQIRELLQSDVSHLLISQRMTAIVVTHDITEAIYMADRIVVMSALGGRFVQEIMVNAPRPRALGWRNSIEANALRMELWRVLQVPTLNENSQKF